MLEIAHSSVKNGHSPGTPLPTQGDASLKTRFSSFANPVSISYRPLPSGLMPERSLLSRPEIERRSGLSFARFSSIEMAFEPVKSVPVFGSVGSILMLLRPSFFEMRKTLSAQI